MERNGPKLEKRKNCSILKYKDVKDRNLYIAGYHSINETLNSGGELNKVLIKKGAQSEHYKELMPLLRKRGIPVSFVPNETLNRLYNRNHQGIIAQRSLIAYQNIDEIISRCYENGKDPFILILDRITDVRNFGAIARTSECTGVDAIVISSTRSVSITPDAIKTSAGALNSIPICRADSLFSVARRLINSGLNLVAATEKGNKYHYESDLTGPIALILGSEDKGISNELLKIINEQIKIPLYGNIGSLNVSVACGVILFESVRQKNILNT